MDLNSIKRVEKEVHERLYEGEDPLPMVSIDEVRKTLLSPCYETGNDKYSDNKMAFHELILREGGWKDKVVLDYACSNGGWSIYFALTGARQVVGFDIAESGIQGGLERINAQGLADKVELFVMDASSLQFPDNSFDIVIGTAVLHHVIKYPNIFEELHRVMKPGSKAYFLEGLADFPLWRLWWKIKGQVPLGDVPIFSSVIRRKAKMFTAVEIVGSCFFYSIKTILERPGAGSLRRQILKTCKGLDNIFFKVCPALRAYGSFSYIVLSK